MFKLIQKLKDKLTEKLGQKGRGMVEYAIILAVVAAIAIATFKGSSTTTNGETTSTGLKGAIGDAFDSASTQIKKAGNVADQ